MFKHIIMGQSGIVVNIVENQNISKQHIIFYE